jgi:hypothetical protein
LLQFAYAGPDIVVMRNISMCLFRNNQIDPAICPQAAKSESVAIRQRFMCQPFQASDIRGALATVAGACLKQPLWSAINVSFV